MICSEEGREWGLADHLYTDDLVLGIESEVDLKVMVRRFVEVCRRRGFRGGKRDRYGRFL